MKSVKTLVKLFAAMAFTAAAFSPAADKTLIDYFLPTLIHDRLTTNAWGVPGVLPRDPLNGLEDQTLKQWY